MERYALLWLLNAVVLLALEMWQGLLNAIGHVLGVVYPVTALFVIALGFVLALLIHFSLVISQLANQNKLLAQHIGLLQQQMQEQQEQRTGFAAPMSSIGGRGKHHSASRGARAASL
jgi:hypothetical protein